MDKLKYIKLEQEDGSYSDNIPLAVDADHVDVNGNTLTNVLGNKADNTDIDNLQTEINSLASGSPKGSYATVSDLTTANPETGVYVIQANGHIYSWTKNGQNAIDLGTYQATEIANLSIRYEKIVKVPNGQYFANWQDGGIASDENQSYNEGDIFDQGFELEYKRTQPIPLKKGMVMLAFLNDNSGTNGISKVSETSNFIETIQKGSGINLYYIIEENELSYYCLTSITKQFNPYIKIYESIDKMFEFSSYNNMWRGGYVLNSNNSIVTASNDNNYIRTDFISLKKGNVVKMKLCAPNSIQLFATYTKNLIKKQDFIIGIGNVNLYDYNYIVKEDCFAIFSNSKNLYQNYEITIYKTIEDYENEINFNNFYSNGNGITSTNGSYQSTNELLVKKGDVIDFYSVSTTNNAYKFAIFELGKVVEGIIENNYDTSSEYYHKSYRNCYVAENNIFVRILNKPQDLAEENVQLNIYPYLFIKNVNIYEKTLTGIGDSYLANHQQNPGLTWLDKICCKYGCNYNNLGINGNGLVYGDNSVMNRLNSIPQTTDIIVVEGGKNDYNNQISIEDFENGLINICNNLMQNYYDKKILVFTPWNTYGNNDLANIKLEDYVESMKKIFKKYSIPVYDSFHNSNMYMWSSLFQSEFCQSTGDGSHLNNNGHNRFMTQAEKRILEL